MSLFQTPDDKQRSEILTYLCSELTVNKDVSIRDLSIRTASFTPRDLHTLVTNAGAVAINRVLAFVKKYVDFILPRISAFV